MTKYYLTTPIYYVNAAPHIGHAYTTIVADLIKRFKRMQGYDAVLTTGSDEHGVNVERAAQRAGKTPKEFCDVIAAEFQRQWQLLGLEIDYFQRTTDPKHARVVQDLFNRCRQNGYIYKGSYTGQYCIFDNLYVNEAKPGDPWQLETWLQPLRLSQPLPTLPLWLAADFSIPLDLEESYEETCKVLRIS